MKLAALSFIRSTTLALFPWACATLRSVIELRVSSVGVEILLSEPPFRIQYALNDRASASGGDEIPYTPLLFRDPRDF